MRPIAEKSCTYLRRSKVTLELWGCRGVETTQALRRIYPPVLCCSIYLISASAESFARQLVGTRSCRQRFAPNLIEPHKKGHKLFTTCSSRHARSTSVWSSEFKKKKKKKEIALCFRAMNANYRWGRKTDGDDKQKTPLHIKVAAERVGIFSFSLFSLLLSLALSLYYASSTCLAAATAVP